MYISRGACLMSRMNHEQRLRHRDDFVMNYGISKQTIVNLEIYLGFRLRVSIDAIKMDEKRTD